MNSSYWLISGVVLALLVCIFVYLRLRPKDQGKRWYLGLLVIPVIAGALFYFLVLKDQANPAATFDRNGNVEQFVDAVGQLEKRLETNPKDYQGQLMLAHSYRAMGRYQDAVVRFGRAWPIIEKDPNNLALFAGSLAIFRGSFEGKPMELVKQALALDSHNPDALMLLGGAEFQQKHYDKAIQAWQDLIQHASLQEEDQQWIEQQIAEAQLALNDPKAYQERLQQREQEMLGEGDAHAHAEGREGLLPSLPTDNTPAQHAPSATPPGHEGFMMEGEK
ncbi:tetratricopeptide repeat protein [Brackiella oedipodis]|uniref:tetratricopeptide repeat protein n=1 Tax=Brackiella oedipodis TaxID=124225 RepID=UPI000A057FF9|nr:tetratricopeptide repeat protein [Brackiella oedipodis]